MGIPDHLTSLLRNLYEGQEATVRTGHGTTDWFQIGKGVRQGCILSPCSFNLYAEYIMRNAGLEEAQTANSTDLETTKFEQLSSGQKDQKRSVFITIPKKGNAKECSNCHTIELISHTSKVMLRILQARLQQCMN